MKKFVFAASAVLMLSACGGKAMIESDMTRMVAASPASPWLTVENKGDAVLNVGGLPSSAKVQVSPDIASSVEAQLRTSLQPKYFTDLIIGCRDLKVATSVSSDEPATANLDLLISCRIVARGKVVQKGYRIRQSSPVQVDAPHLDTLVPQLLTGASKQLADQVWAEVVATGVRLK
ncbi:MAG: lipoprotein [Luteibacter sp.]